MDISEARAQCIAISKQIDKMLKEIPTLGVDDVGQSLDAFIAARTLKDHIDALAKEAGAVVQEFADHHIPALLQRHKLTAAPHRLGSIKMERKFSTTVHDRPGAHSWLVKNGLADLIIETTNAATLSAVAKGMVEEGKGREFPTAYFKTTIRDYAKFVPTKG
jgi:hypothetical protein